MAKELLPAGEEVKHALVTEAIFVRHRPFRPVCTCGWNSRECFYTEAGVAFGHAMHRVGACA